MKVNNGALDTFVQLDISDVSKHLLGDRLLLGLSYLLVLVSLSHFYVHTFTLV